MDPYSYSLGYACAMADSDGCLHYIEPPRAAITFRQVHTEPLTELTKALDILGFRYSWYGPYDGGKGRPMYSVRIHSQDEVRRFLTEVGFRHPERAIKAQKWLAGEPMPKSWVRRRK